MKSTLNQSNFVFIVNGNCCFLQKNIHLKPGEKPFWVKP